MKTSHYTRLFQAPDGTWLAFNAWTTALAEIESQNVDFLRALLADPDGTPCDNAEKREMREALIDARFLVEDAEDEPATVKADWLRDRFRTDLLHLTIAPTLDCNFRCDYCYEEHLKVGMSSVVQDALIQWTGEKLERARELHVTWYGGEPLLPKAYPVVEKLSRAFIERCRDRGIEYAAHLVTNGFFLDRSRAEALRALGVAKVQVTLDGPRQVHDERRSLAGGQGTFDRIIQNLEEVVDVIPLQLRINVDERNARATLELAEFLRERGIASKVRPYLAQVTHDGAACGNIVEFCYSSEAYAGVEMEIYREAAERKLPLSRYPFRIPGAFCTAERLNGYVVSPTGSLFKCWHEVTMSPEQAIGSLLDGQTPLQKLNEDRWLAWDTQEKPGCRSCEILPMCHGGCPVEARKHPESDQGACEHLKFHLQPLLELHYLHQTPQAASTTPARDVSG